MECDKCGRDRSPLYHVGGGVFKCAECLGAAVPKHLGAKHRNDNVKRQPWTVDIE